METVLTSGGAVAMVHTVVNFVRYVRARDANGYVTQLVVWLTGILVAVLVRFSDVADSFNLGTHTLEHGNAGTVILAGLGIGSAASLVNELKKAVDRTDSAVKPPLIPDEGPVVPPPAAAPGAPAR